MQNIEKINHYVFVLKRKGKTGNLFKQFFDWVNRGNVKTTG